jgi:hypothetical protein
VPEGKLITSTQIKQVHIAKFGASRLAAFPSRAAFPQWDLLQNIARLDDRKGQAISNEDME